MGSWPHTVHYSFDFAQQVHYPPNPLQPGPMYFKTARKCAVLGVCCEGIPQQINYLIDEASDVGKSANMVVSLLHHFLWHHGLGEIDVGLHGQNNCSAGICAHIHVHVHASTTYIIKAHHKREQCTCTHMNTKRTMYIYMYSIRLAQYCYTCIVYIAGAVIIRSVKLYHVCVACIQQYLAWRVLTGLHCKVTMSFMLVGHTKFFPDWCFALFKQCYRCTFVSSLDDVAEAVNSSADVNVAQLVGTQSGRPVVPA